MLYHAVIAFTFGVAAASFDYSGRATLEDVTKFFNTQEVIVLYMRSYSRKIGDYDPMCISNTVKKLEGSLIRLYQRYDYGTPSWHKCISYGIYYNISKDPGMDVAPVMQAQKTNELDCSRAAPLENSKGLDTLGFEGDFPHGRKYIFQYYDEREKCAVITFSDKRCSIKCELHVWYQYFLKDKSNCIREYKYLCGKRHEYKLYDKTFCGWGLPNI
ncbi:uncharacterized protein LOC125947571 isoform X1 [Dermacentor silvarum]|uniref:uncharacterized protein LOC125947571 isoform X1 n=1 Tax=Dermacentor silvarum TaxID=543639 RepID=UPI002100F404|nr:uncharacterized protein LOC125947571 isoform X1 [Dermacentor silvarum]